MVVKKVENVSLKHKTLGKNLKNARETQEKKKRKTRDSLVVKKVENVSLKHKTPGKNLKTTRKKPEKKGRERVKVVVSPLSYHCHLVPPLSTNNVTAFISK